MGGNAGQSAGQEMLERKLVGTEEGLKGEVHRGRGGQEEEGPKEEVWGRGSA